MWDSRKPLKTSRQKNTNLIKIMVGIGISLTQLLLWLDSILPNVAITLTW